MAAIPEASFSFFIKTIALQIAVALGKITNPQNGKTEKNLRQAKFLLGTLEILKEKTANNLTGEEEQMLINLIGEMKKQFQQFKEDSR